VEGQHDRMLIRCSQPGCTLAPKIINRSRSGTNNYKHHYRKEHPGIPVTLKEEKEAPAAKRAHVAQARGFFEKPQSEQTHDELYRSLLLEFIIKNNLSFSLVDQPETRKLFTFLSPTTKQVSRRRLIKDLEARYQVGEEQLHQKLQDHVESGGRISLTTDGWAGNNKLDYITVTGHFETKAGEQVVLLLDIIELTKPIHDGVYLCEKLLEVTNRFSITCAILAITRDNASTNNLMLDEFEACVEAQWEEMEELEQAQFCCKFNRVDGDVRCCAHIYNIAVQAGKYRLLALVNITNNIALKAIKSEPNKSRSYYQHKADHAYLPDNRLEFSAFFKLRSLAIIFKLRRLPRDELKRMCKTLDVKYLDLMCDMPVRWNSTDKMLQAALRMEKPIRAVLMNQE
jgi:hypothetical protein